MIGDAIKKLVDKMDLTYEEAYQSVDEIMNGQTTEVQTAAFLAALSTKSAKAETIDEILGCAEAMLSHATRVSYPDPLLEIVGTGGDGSNTFNISTTAAFVISAGGVKVAKHGNRAASSKSGTVDCQEALGINCDQNPEKAVKMLDSVGMCFFHAQKYHLAMKYVGPIRKELGIRTVFNILGPLTNPASPKYMVMGVYDGGLVEPLARVLRSMGVEHGMVVFGEDVLDELSTACITRVCEIDGDSFHSYLVSARDFGMPECSKADLVGGDPAENAQITVAILDGTEKGPRRDTVLMNAGAGLYLAGKASSFAEGVKQAGELVDSGKALAQMQAYRDASNE